MSAARNMGFAALQATLAEPAASQTANDRRLQPLAVMFRTGSSDIGRHGTRAILAEP